jgi:hypothetical protein
MLVRRMVASIAGALALLGFVGIASASASPSTFLSQLSTPSTIASTVPANGDVNPYGVAVVGTSVGNLIAGDVLVSNFNAKSGIQGTGSTVVEVSPQGSRQLFAKVSALPSGQSCPDGIGLSTALAILPGGWVVVGSFPAAKNGNLPGSNIVGCLIVLNDEGQVVETITNKNIDGPWDMAATSTATSASLFVSNALGGNTQSDNGVPLAGNCTIVRLDLALSPSAPPKLTSTKEIGSDFPWKANKASFVLAPTGLALGKNGTLYVDNTQTNTVSAIRDAARRSSPVSAASSTIATGHGLNAPLGMIVAPNGDLLVVNGNNGNAVELTPKGHQVATKTLVHNGAGDLFGLALEPENNGLYFVNDGANTLEKVQASSLG